MSGRDMDLCLEEYLQGIADGTIDPPDLTLVEEYPEEDWETEDD